MQTDAMPGAAAAAPRWLWPIRLPPRIGAQLLTRARRLGAWLGPWPCWLLAGALVGLGPCLLDYVTGLPVGRLLTAVLLAPLLVAAIVQDSVARGLGTVAAAFGMHSIVVILLAAHEPATLAAVMPDGQRYWQESHQWITTGLSREYDLRWWLPAHVQWFGAVTMFTYLSLGFVTFWQGLYEVDLMNFYVGQLLAHSSNPLLALGLGWHPWSLCRAVGYLFISFEVASYSCERLTQTPLSSRRRRQVRWLVGLSFLLLDGALKYFMLETVRGALAANMI